MERLPEFIANHLFLCTLFVSLLMLLIWSFLGDSITGLKPLQPSAVTQLMNRENAVIVDIRKEDEFENGHIISAKNIPAEKLQDSVSELEKHKNEPIVMYCQNGMDASRQLRFLKQSGFQKLYFLKGGLSAWQSANFPITRDKS